MAQDTDTNVVAQEKAAGKKAARNIRRALRSQLATVKSTGLMLSKLSVGTQMRFGQLESININATRVTFIQHYGFEGIKSNGASMRLTPRNHFNIAFSKTNAINELATDIANIRANEITSKIKF